MIYPKDKLLNMAQVDENNQIQKGFFEKLKDKIFASLSTDFGIGAILAAKGGNGKGNNAGGQDKDDKEKGSNGNGSGNNGKNEKNKDKVKKERYNNGKGNSENPIPEEELLDELFAGTSKIVFPEIMDKKPQYLISPQSRVAYTYDAEGNRMSMEDDNGKTQYIYNAADQLVQADSIQYEYDERGNLIAETSDEGIKEYTYDRRNLLKEVTYGDGTYVKYGYDGLGRMVYREDANYDLNKIGELQQNVDNNASVQPGKQKSNNGLAISPANGKGNNQGNGNGNGNGNDNNNGKKNGNGNNGTGGNNGNDNGNSGNNGNSNNNGNGNVNNGNGSINGNAGGNGYGKYNNPGKGNKYGIYKHKPQEIRIEPTDIEKSRYLYVGQSDYLHKEYSSQGAPYAEYYQANGQVISQKMFGLHGRITPGKEETLKTNGGLMYYQYDGLRNVVELTNRHGNEIEQYRYDTFGNIYTGVTAPYNTIGYTGHEYDEKSGLINMTSRWYNSNNGRFITEDTYRGDVYNPQSLNRYAYVMNNPVNLWDPTGRVPEWVGRDIYYTVMPDEISVDEVYYWQSSNTSSSGWYLINKITNLTEIICEYKATVTNTWIYDHYDFSYTTSTDPETGETVYEHSGTTHNIVTFSETDYYYKSVTKRALEIANENEQYIRDLAGDPPGDNDIPLMSISTRQVNGGPIEVLDPADIILRNTGKKPTGQQKLVAGAVQSELNKIFNTQLAADGWYGTQTAGTVRDLQKILSLPATGILDAQTFYQLELAYANGAKFTRSAAQAVLHDINESEKSEETNKTYEELKKKFEDIDNRNSGIRWDGCTKELLEAKSKFENLIEEKGWSITYTSAYRSLEYQEHLYDVIQKINEDKFTDEKTKELYLAEKKKLGIGTKVAKPNADAPHTKGIAFDAIIFDEKGNRLNTLKSIDDELLKVAKKAGLLNNIKDDRVHFQLQ